MKISIVKPDQFKTSRWSGGTSTELYIFPPGSSYSGRNFEIRISTAKVEVPESTFTYLPGISRRLMILEGAIEIIHPNHYHKHLKPFEVDSFSGNWKTTAKGTCTDFNVMVKQGIQNNLYHLNFKNKGDYTFNPRKKCKNLFLYGTSGKVILQFPKENYMLEKGYLVKMKNVDFSSIALNSAEAFGIVVVEIY